MPGNVSLRNVPRGAIYGTLTLHVLFAPRSCAVFTTGTSGAAAPSPSPRPQQGPRQPSSGPRRLRTLGFPCLGPWFIVSDCEAPVSVCTLFKPQRASAVCPQLEKPAVQKHQNLLTVRYVQHQAVDKTKAASAVKEAFWQVPDAMEPYRDRNHLRR